MRFRAKKGPAPEELLDEVGALFAAARESADPAVERELLQARHRAGLALLERPSNAAPVFPEPDFAALPGGDVPEVTAADLTPELVRAAFLRSGCLLVRGLVPPSDVERLLEAIDRAYVARREGGDAYEPFATDPRFERIAFDRGIVSADGWGGLWPADAPHAALAMFDAFDRAGLLSLAEGYLGERPAISVNKSLLRRVEPPVPGEPPGPSAWHQDGAFLGDVRALNVWLALSRCGDVAPGMDLVPRRLDGMAAAGTEGAVFDWSVSQAVAEAAAGEAGIVRPVFEPGDVLLFDELFLHATATDPSMRNARYAVECWFFGPSRFPGGYAPLAA
jgi:hypothetical protein